MIFNLRKSIIICSVIISVVIIFCSCCPQRLLNTSTNDSTRIEIVERRVEFRDTVVVEIPVERVYAQISVDSISILENSVAISRAELTKGVLHHSLESKPITLTKEVATEVVARDSIIFRDRVTTNVVEVERELSWWQQTQIKGFWTLLMVCVCAFVVLKN